MSGFAEYARFDGLALAALVKTREVSPREIFDAAVRTIQRLNPKLNAVTVTMFEEAAETLKAGVPSGPFEGVPLLLKDFAGALYKGAICSMSSRLLANNVADHDSEAVARYKRAGTVVVGRSNIPNFGPAVTTESRFRGPTRNPWDTGRMAGGSSGGAAAAVAAGMVPVAHATDAAGSLRVPASHCGLFGLKTTRGRISSGPDLGEAAGGFGTNHVITRTVRDSAAMLDATAGYAAGDPYTAPPESSYLASLSNEPGQLRMAFSTKGPGGRPVDEHCVRAVEAAAELCADLGHSVEEDAPVFDFAALIRHFVLVHGAHWSRLVLGLIEKLGREPTSEEIEGSVVAWARYCSTKSATDYAEALQAVHRIGRQIASFFGRYDVFLSPTASQPALPLGMLDATETDLDKYLDAMWGHMSFTAQFNCSGQPAMSVPLHWTESGLPVGVQFAARFGAETTLFQLAAQLETARPWKDRRPPVSA